MRTFTDNNPDGQLKYFWVLIFVFLCLAGTASAQTNITWTGGPGDWSDASKWDGNPNGNNVFIDGGKGTTSNVLLNISTQVNNLTIDSGDSLGGAGSIYRSIYSTGLIDNKGMIVANGSAELFVNITSLTNTGTLRADGGMLTLYNGTITNTNATIEALNGSAVNLQNTKIVGGNLSASNSGLFTVPTGWSAILNGVTLTTGSLLNAENNTSSTLVDTFTNNGTIALNSSGGWTRLYMSGSNVTLGGTGTVNMSNNILNSIAGSSNDVFTIGAGQTIQGAGQFNDFKSIVNQGIIVASGSAGLTFNMGAGASLTNTGTLRADGGTLTLLGGTFTNTNRTIEALNGSAVSLQNTTIVGGNLSASNSGLFSVPTGWSAILNGVTLTTGSLLNAENNTSSTIVDTFTNNGTIALNSSGGWTRLYMSGSNVTLGGTGTVNMSNNILNSIAGSSNNFTIGAGQTIQGAGQFNNFNSIVNQGIIVASGSAGLTFDMGAGTSLTNSGIFQVNAGSTMKVNDNRLNNYSSNTLTGGTYKVYGTAGNAGNMRLVNADIQTNAATVLLDGLNSNLLRDDTSANALANFSTNAAAGSFTIQNGRSFTTVGAFSNAGVVQVGNILGDTSTFTTTGAFSNAGTLQMRGGTFSAGGSGSLTNSGTGEINGYGTVSTPALNHGLVRAAGGNLNARIDGQSGTVQIDPGATLTLSGNSDASYLIHNGNTAGSLALGSYNFTVDKDYTNANFGTGNSFDRRANVSGSGQIIGNNAAQAITGDVTNGATPTVTLNLGNVRGGTLKTLNYQIANTGTGADIRGAVQTTVNGGNISDSRLSGTGVTAANFGPIASGANSGNRGVTFNASSGGSLTGQSIAVVSNFDNITSQVININGLASALAQGNAIPNTPQPLVLGNFHVGTGPNPSQNFAVTNTTSGAGAEQLGISTATTTGNFTATNNLLSLIAGGATANNAVTVQVSGSGAGVNNGSLAIQYLTDGTNIDSSFTAQNANLQNISVQATGYNLAIGNVTPTPMVLGNQRVGGTGTQALTVSNAAPVSPYTETLSAGFGLNTGNAFNNGGTVSGIAGGGSNNTAMRVGVDTGTAGARTGTVTVNLTSNEVGASGLGNTSLTPQTINVSGNVYQVAQPTLASNNVVFSNRHVGDAATQALSLTNTSAAPAGYQEALNSAFSGKTGNATTSGTINLLGQGATNNTNLIVGIDTSTAGAKSGTASLGLQSDGTGTSGLSPLGLGSQTINVSGNVYRLADPLLGSPLNFGNVLVGSGPVIRTLNLTNNATSDGFSESLNASFGTLTNNGAGSFNANGSITGLGAGLTDNLTMQVTLTPTTAGSINASYQILLASNGDGTSGLGLTTLSPQDLGLQGLITGVAGNLAQAGNAAPNPVNFGKLRVGDPAPANLALTIGNVASAPAEGLNASITTVNSGFTASGSFTGLTAGSTNNSSLLLGFNGTGSAGLKTGTATIALASDGTYNGGVITILPSQDIAMNAEVYQVAQPNVPASMNLGNVRIGGSSSQAITIGNTNISPAGYQEGLNASVGATSNATGSGGPITNLAAGATSNAISVGMTAALAGVNAGSVTLNLASNGTGTSGLPTLSLADQTVNASITGYRLANPQLNTPSVTLAARVGDASPSSNIGITNSSPDVYTEGLKASISTSSAGFSANGAINNLAAQGSDATTMKVNLGAGTAGVFTGTATLTLASTGAGTTGASDYALSDQSVSLNGKVYTPAVGQIANAIIDFSIVHVGDGVLSQALTIKNNAAVTVPNDLLTGSFSGASGPFIAGGNLGAGLNAQQTDSSSLIASLNTSTAGVFSDSSAKVSFKSHNDDMTDLPLSDIPMNLIAQVNNYANPVFHKDAGDGAWSIAGLTFTLEFGNIVLNSTKSAEFSIWNDVTGPADLLSGSFDVSGVSHFTTTGFDEFPGIEAGDTFDDLEVMLNTFNLGLFSDKIILRSTGYNASGYSGGLDNITLVLNGNVIESSSVPEPMTCLLLVIGLAGIGIIRKKFTN